MVSWRLKRLRDSFNPQVFKLIYCCSSQECLCLSGLEVTEAPVFRRAAQALERTFLWSTGGCNDQVLSVQYLESWQKASIDSRQESWLTWWRERERGRQLRADSWKLTNRQDSSGVRPKLGLNVHVRRLLPSSPIFQKRPVTTS